jgi:hypothetical protein
MRRWLAWIGITDRPHFGPFIVDFTRNVLRAGVLTPFALGERVPLISEVRAYAAPACVVSVLGPLAPSAWSERF